MVEIQRTRGGVRSRIGTPIESVYCAVGEVKHDAGVVVFSTRAKPGAFVFASIGLFREMQVAGEHSTRSRSMDLMKLESTTKLLVTKKIEVSHTCLFFNPPEIVPFCSARINSRFPHGSCDSSKENSQLDDKFYSPQ